MLLNKCSILLHNFSKIFFKGLFYFYWKGGYTDRRDMKIFRLMIHSPSERKGRCYAGPKPGASSGAGSQSFRPSWTAFPGRKQGAGWEAGAAGIRIGAHMGSRHIQGEDLNHCAIAPGP